MLPCRRVVAPPCPSSVVDYHKRADRDAVHHAVGMTLHLKKIRCLSDYTWLIGDGAIVVKGEKVGCLMSDRIRGRTARSQATIRVPCLASAMSAAFLLYRSIDWNGANDFKGGKGT